MHSDFMSAVGAYMSLGSVSARAITVNATRYMAGVQVGGVTLSASSLRVDIPGLPVPSDASRVTLAADRLGFGQNAELLMQLAPFIRMIDPSIFSSGSASSSFAGGALSASANAVRVGAPISIRDRWTGQPAESLQATFRNFDGSGTHLGNAFLPYADVGAPAHAGSQSVVTGGVRHITTGAGSDTISAAGAGHVDAGDGDNTLSLSNTGHVHTGTGNDRIVAMRAGHISDRGGANTITATDVGNISIEGSGRNTINATRANHITTGAGNDTITATSVHHIDAGEGHNVIDATGAGNIDAGSGNDIINATGVNMVDAGHGDNIVTVARARSVYTGAGNDRVSVSDINSHVDVGDGDNIVAAANIMNLRSGNGRDTIAVAGAWVVETGGGDDTIDATDIAWRVEAGAGNDKLTLARAAAVYRRGDGTDTVRAGERVELRMTVRQDEVDTTVRRDAQGRVLAVDIALKDGSGGVSIVAGPSGSGDATIRFADGTSVPYALVADGAR